MFDNWASRSENLTYVTWDPHLNIEQTLNPMTILITTNGLFVSKIIQIMSLEILVWSVWMKKILAVKSGIS